MVVVAVGLATLIAVELLLRLPFLASMRGVVSTSARATAVLKNRKLSDDVKERILPRYALRIMQQSLFMLLILVAAATPFLVFSLILGEPFTSVLAEWSVVAVTTILALGYVTLRRTARWRTTP